MRCLNCNSANVAIVEDRGAYRTSAICQDCGYDWDPGNPMEARRRLTPEYQEEVRRQRKDYERRRAEEDRLAKKITEARIAASKAQSEYKRGRFRAWVFGLIGWGMLIGGIVGSASWECGEPLGLGVVTFILFTILSLCASHSTDPFSLKERFRSAQKELEYLQKKQK